MKNPEIWGFSYYLVLLRNLWKGYYYSHIIGEEADIQVKFLIQDYTATTEQNEDSLPDL